MRIAILLLSITSLWAAKPPRSVALTWTASVSSDVAGYNIYRADGTTATWNLINTGLVTGTTYNDTNVVDSAIYYYRATAVDSAGNESTYSNVAQAVMNPTKRTGGSTHGSRK